MDPGELTLGATLPDGSRGASMSLSQAPCYFANGSNNPYCCSPQSISKKINGVSQLFVVNVCASWSGTHLSSAFCAQYGVLEVEARYDMPSDGGAYQVRRRFCMGACGHAVADAPNAPAQFFGVYMYGCRDPWGNSYNGGVPSPNCDVSWCARVERAACGMHAQHLTCIAGTRWTSWCTTTRRTGRPTAPACS